MWSHPPQKASISKKTNSPPVMYLSNLVMSFFVYPHVVRLLIVYFVIIYFRVVDTVSHYVGYPVPLIVKLIISNPSVSTAKSGSSDSFVKLVMVIFWQSSPN